MNKKSQLYTYCTKSKKTKEKKYNLSKTALFVQFQQVLCVICTTRTTSLLLRVLLLHATETSTLFACMEDAPPTENHRDKVDFPKNFFYFLFFQFFIFFFFESFLFLLYILCCFSCSFLCVTFFCYSFYCFFVGRNGLIYGCCCVFISTFNE